MAIKFKVGDIIYIEKCKENKICRDSEICIGHLREICEINDYYEPAAFWFDFYNKRGDYDMCNTTVREARKATDREEFLYKIYGGNLKGEN